MDVPLINGELQTQVMLALWRLDMGTVREVRSALPPRYRGAYSTVQTVLNRLADRGLLGRARAGHAVVYRPSLTEAEYLSGAITQTLAGVSQDVRRAVLARLLGDLPEADLTQLRRLAGGGGVSLS